METLLHAFTYCLMSYILDGDPAIKTYYKAGAAELHNMIIGFYMSSFTVKKLDRMRPN